MIMHLIRGSCGYDLKKHLYTKIVQHHIINSYSNIISPQESLQSKHKLVLLKNTFNWYLCFVSVYYRDNLINIITILTVLKDVKFSVPVRI